MNIYNKHQKKTQLIVDLNNTLNIWEEIFEGYEPKIPPFEKNYYNACLISLEADKVNDIDFINALPLLIEINLEEEGYFKPLITRISKINFRLYEPNQRKTLIDVSDMLISLDEIINNRNQQDMLTLL